MELPGEKGEDFILNCLSGYRQGLGIDWREQPASGSQPVTLAVRRALVKPSVKQPK